MDKEFLSDYAAREEEEINKNFENFSGGLSNLYPKKNRFHKLKEPVGETVTDFKPIWPQIPLFGSLIIRVNPSPEEIFNKNYGLQDGDFERLVDFCKSTGKVQFIINGHPELYEGLDYLTPLFEELRAPIIFNTPLDMIIDKRKLTKYKTEFKTLINIPSSRGTSFLDQIQNEFPLRKIVAGFTPEEIEHENFRYYSFLKEFGYSDIIDYYENLLLDDSKKALRFLAMMGCLIVDTSLKLYNADRIFSLEELTRLSSGYKSSDLIKDSSIHEIGKFLLKKLTYMPESFDACKDVISRYQQEDLYKVNESLHKGVTDSNPDVISNKGSELSEILENVWSDATLENRIKKVNYGIPVSMALIGGMAAGPVGGLGGLLSGLGFNTLSGIVGINSESLSETLAKKTVPNHLINIFDFKNKYNIKNQKT